MLNATIRPAKLGPCRAARECGGVIVTVSRQCQHLQQKVQFHTSLYHQEAAAPFTIP